MPGPDGKLTEEDRAKVVAWLSQYPKAADSQCPLCSSPEWMVAEYLVQPITLGPNTSLQLGGIGYPQVMLISNPCGYTRFVNAVIVGVLPGSKPEEKKG
jgi:hypothetical protein